MDVNHKFPITRRFYAISHRPHLAAAGLGVVVFLALAAAIPVPFASLLHRGPLRLVAEIKTPGPSTIAISPDGKQLAVTKGMNPKIEVWDIDRQKLLNVLARVQTVEPVTRGTSIAYSPDGKYLVASDAAHLVDPEELRRRSRAGNHDVPTVRLADLPPDQRFHAKVWDGRTLALLGTLPAPPNEFRGYPGRLCIAGPQQRLVLVNSLSIAVYDLAERKYLRQYPWANLAEDPTAKTDMGSIACNPVKNELAIGAFSIPTPKGQKPPSYEERAKTPLLPIIILDLDTGKVVKRFRAHTNRITGLAYSTDGLMLISGGANGEVMPPRNPEGPPEVILTNPIIAWNATSWEKVAEYRPTISKPLAHVPYRKLASASALAPIRDFPGFVSAEENRFIRLWRFGNPDAIDIHEEPYAGAISVTPDGHRIAVNGNNRVLVFEIKE